MAEPVRLDINDIRFEDGKLWQPRYESLIDYSCAPAGFQFEPAFLAYTEQEVEVVFRIADSENAVFDVQNDGTVRWGLLPVAGPAVSVKVSVEVDGSDPRSCRVIWKPSGATLTALHIACRPAEGRIPDAVTLIEGGVYLVIIEPRESLPPSPQAVNKGGAPRAGTVRFLGIDEHNRPVYDLFRNVAPLELVLEPALRAGHGERVGLRLALDLVPPYAGSRFKVGTDGQAEMIFNPPAERPACLVDTPAEEDHKACSIRWDRPGMTEGKTSNFYAVLEHVPANVEIRIDPTVIEPPACDPSGVCSPPRNGDPGVSAG
ncbi:MAG: hypothetical protein ABUT39_03875 [Acidobacteriota bacterium]